MKVLHCNDPNCAGGNESITSPDTAGIQDCCARSWYTSMVLDPSGNPVITYAQHTAGLKVLHCNDVNCAGADESIATNAATINVDGNSLRPDASGNPVVAFAEFVNGGDVRLLHCNDANCAGGDESLSTAATLGDATEAFVSMALDSSGGNPVVTYNNQQSFPNRLVVVHCNDSDCAGGDESITQPDSGGTNGNGRFSSLVLDGAGNPAISYDQGSLGTIAIMRCNDPNCAGADETITLPRGPTFCATRTTSLALDASGNPVAGYYCGQGNTVEVLHCPDATCVGADPDSDGAGAVLDLDDDNDGCPDAREAQTAAGSQVSGGLRSLKSFWDFFQVPSGTVRDGSISSLDIFAVIGRFNATGDPGIDPLSAPPAAPAYHTAFDRGASAGPNPWNLTAANGSIASTDIFAIIGQFGHSCV